MDGRVNLGNAAPRARMELTVDQSLPGCGIGDCWNPGYVDIDPFTFVLSLWRIWSWMALINLYRKDS